MAQYSVNETKEALSLVIALYKAGAKSLSDGKLDLADAANLFAVLPKVGPALSDLSKIPQELSELDASEAGELIAHVSMELGVENAKAQAIAGAGLKIIFDAWELVKAIKA